MSYSMQYSPAENTVLVVDADRDLGGVFERDASGTLLRVFHVPVAQTFCYSATRGPDSHVFGTTSKPDIDIVEWRADGSVGRTIDCYPTEIHPVRILWAGIVPEPGPFFLLIVGIAAIGHVRPDRRDAGQQCPAPAITDRREL
jgi:hypothetical protein